MATPDAVTVGDYHLKNVVAWHLEGRPRGTDEEVMALIGGRVVRMLEEAGPGAAVRTGYAATRFFGISELIAEKRQSPLPRAEGSPKHGDTC